MPHIESGFVHFEHTLSICHKLIILYTKPICKSGHLTLNFILTKAVIIKLYSQNTSWRAIQLTINKLVVLWWELTL
jgi:hypothetical protein